MVYISQPTWVLHVDGASNFQGSGAGLIIAEPNGFVFEYALRFSFKATNNQAEYEALITGLKLAARLEVKNLKVFTDSQLVVGQTIREYEARDPTLAKYHEKSKLCRPCSLGSAYPTSLGWMLFLDWPRSERKSSVGSSWSI